METKYYHVLLSMVDGLGPRWRATLTEAFGSPGAAWNAPETEIKAIPRIPRKVVADLIHKRDTLQPEQVIANLKQSGIQFIFREDPDYPPLLEQIFDPPQVLYFKGDPRLFQLPMVAVVGARKASPYGLAAAEKISRELAKAGLCVVSGMARGIDSAAHKGALSVNGHTVAVLGCGVDVVYPAENRRLMSELINRGLVVTEFPPGTGPAAGNFPVRNRIISGLAKGVLIIEAAEKSGSLITADCALEQGRDVFAVPGQITNPLNKGAHKLIKQGAKLVEDVSDILVELGGFSDIPDSSKNHDSKKINLTTDEQTIYNIISDEPVCSEVIIEQAGLDPAQVISMLLFMELKGLIRKLPGELYIRSF